jgi:hypothetical protein
MLLRNVPASKIYRSGHKETVISTDSYRSGNVLSVIATKIIALTARQKR